MNHRKKAEGSSKFLYILIMSAGVFMACAVLFSMLAGIRINFIFTELINSSMRVKVNITEAQREFLANINEPADSTLNSAWDYISLAEFNTNLLFEEREKLGIFALPVKDANLKQQIQQLQKLLVEYKNLSEKVAADSSTDTDRVEWRSQFDIIQSQAQIIQNELNKLLTTHIYNFKIIQFVLIGATLLLSFLSIFVFYRYEKQRSIFTRRLNEASTTIETRAHRTTLTEEALQETQRRLSTLVQNLPGIVYRCKNDSDFTMEYVSDMCLLITGYRAEELINNKTKAFTDLILTEDKTKRREEIQLAVEERKPFQLVYRIKTASGFEKWIWEQGVGIYSDTEDEPIAMEGFITDITEQKSIQDQLSLQSNALEAAANGIMITDKDGKILWTNNAFNILTGYTLKEVMGLKPSIFKSGEHADSFYAHMWSVILSGSTWRGEIINKRKNGEKYYEEMTITPVKNPSGEIVNFVSIKQDISERKKAEESLRESELRFRGLYENATVGIYRTSIEGKILMANPTLLKILGYNSYEEISNIDTKDAYLNEETREHFKQQLLLMGRIHGFESKWKKKDGEIIYIRESARLVRNEDERPIYFEGSIEDITENKKAEEELIIAKEKAEQSDKLKTEFLSQMSHEIRTPLNVIINFSDLIREELQDKVDHDLSEGFAVVDAEGKRIMRTIDLIINMSQLQTGQYESNPEKFNIYESVLANVYQEYSELAKKKNIQIGLTVKAVDPYIYADEFSVHQIFLHLLDNAVKFTMKGKIEITLGRDSRKRLYVDVVDTGIGISEEYQKLLFTPFTKEEMGYTKRFEGNGLGLALTKRYCELNNASIKVKSIKGKGTAFRVTFMENNIDNA